jgi:BlaI family penicillinase repressor
LILIFHYKNFEKVYDGSLHLLIKNFIKHEKLTPKEIEELRRLLDEKSKQGGDEK